MWKIAHGKNINTHGNSDFTAHNIRYSTKDMTHLRRSGTSVRDAVLFTEHAHFK